MVEELGLSIVAVGSQGERPIVEDLQALSRVPIVNLAGQTDIGQLIALMAGARVVVDNVFGIILILGTLGAAYGAIYQLEPWK